MLTILKDGGALDTGMLSSYITTGVLGCAWSGTPDWVGCVSEIAAVGSLLWPELTEGVQLQKHTGLNRT